MQLTYKLSLEIFRPPKKFSHGSISPPEQCRRSIQCQSPPRISQRSPHYVSQIHRLRNNFMIVFIRIHTKLKKLRNKENNYKKLKKLKIVHLYQISINISIKEAIKLLERRALLDSNFLIMLNMIILEKTLILNLQKV